MSNVQLAFDIGGKNIFDRLIKLRTQSDTSHVEIVIDGFKYSSYPGIGVRKDIFIETPGMWRLYEIPEVPKEQVLNFFEKTQGCAYDWLGVIIGQLFYVKVDNPKKYFCSEWCAAALGFPQACRFSPALLEVVIDNTKLIFS